MSTSPTTGPETTFIAEPGSLEATVCAVIDAPLRSVYRAYTEPDLLIRWQGPAELTTKVDRFEAVPGGSWRLVHVAPDGTEYAFHGVFHTVSPDRIVQTFEFEGVPGHVCLETLTLEEVDGGTKVTAQSVFQSVEDRDGMKDSGMEAHAPIGMAQLAELLKTL